MSGLLRSTALGVALAVVAPGMRAPDVFVYRSAQAENGPHIPDWIQAACCGPKDVHRLTMGEVHGPMPLREAYAELGQKAENASPNSSAYTVDGYHQPVFAYEVKPSQDGSVWAFYRTDPDGSQSGMYCLFLPMEF